LLIKLVMYGTPSVHTEVCNALFAGLTKYSVWIPVSLVAIVPIDFS